MSTLPAGAGRRCHALLNTLHSVVALSPDNGPELAGLGIDDRHAAYFAARTAPLGRVSAGAVTALFHNFSHDLIARHLPAVWNVTTPEEVLAARLRAADSTLRRLLGDEALASPELAEAARLAVRATEGCARSGRPMYAALAGLPVPETPHLALWHAATLLREHRGDGHFAVLLLSGLDPLEAMVSHAATGEGFSLEWLAASRGWDMEQLTAAQDRLRARGLLAADGTLTEAGTALRDELERETDRLDAAPYEHLGAQDTERLTELLRPFARAAAAGFPARVRG
ncbi:hypothetical protein GCM10010218_04750 [Streptomyces mashuensis]|uniref:SalK n=1 Tax=Streptomyces mashuensis TaxID=33904 RepID=A0A919AWI8_9ACTN|nr:hypothetical protein [Streptomyces mashuensis]GHF26871.1 hypothetical protein GCM10010218_04750 [Streptomyces mashuensis]